MAEHEDPRPPLAEEALRLVGAVQNWARDTFPAGPDGHSGPECQWCPLCQFMAVLRGERPEVTERVAEAGTALASALRALVDVASQKSQQQSHEQSPEPPAPRVQHIDLGHDD